MPYKKPNLVFKIATEKECLENILDFLKPESLELETAKIICDNLGLEISKLKENSNEENNKYVTAKLVPYYNGQFTNIKNAVNIFNETWLKNEKLILSEFEKIFNIKFSTEIETYIAAISINPVCPRFLSTKTFYLNFNMKLQNALETCIHEMLHFIWFDVFKEVMPRFDESEYEFPYLPWLLSEIAIDPLFRNSKLKQFISYGPTYQYFYEIIHNDEFLIEIFNKMYKSNKIEDFMKMGIMFLQNNQELTKSLIR